MGGRRKGWGTERKGEKQKAVGIGKRGGKRRVYKKSEVTLGK